MARYAPKIDRPNNAESLSPYCEVLATAEVHGWDVALGFGKQGWLLDVLDGRELIARGRSDEKPPHCFRLIAMQARLALERSGKLNE